MAYKRRTYELLACRQIMAFRISVFDRRILDLSMWLSQGRRLMSKPLDRPKVRETRHMPLPLQIGIVAAVRQVVGATIRLRHAWQGDNGTVYVVLDGEQIVAYLKLAAGVQAERERLEWLERRLPVPRVLSSGAVESTEWLLLTPCRGLDLAHLKHTEPANRIVALLA